ncbi:MAG: Spy/CpxP family protein refolding chaperone [candidate division FCPU426 bacterium]
MWNGMKKWSIAALLLTVLAGWSLPARAEMPEGPGPEAVEEAGPPLMEALNLTQDQIAALKKDKLANRRQMISWRAEMENLQLDLENELDNSKPNKAQIEKLARRIGELHGQMIAARAQSVLFLRGLLTPEQQKILDTMRLRPGCPGMGEGMHGQGMGKPGMMGGHGQHSGKDRP